MHVDAVITRETAGAMSGAWLSFERLCQGVAACGHRVEVVTWPETPPPGPGGGAEAAARLRASCQSFAEALRDRWRRRRPDLVHIELAGNTGTAAGAVARELGLPVTSTFHHMHRHAPPDRQAAIGRLLRDFHRGCDATVALSRASREQLLALGGPDAVVIPDGVDTGRFNPRRRDEACRTAWGAGPGDVVVFWAGRLIPQKGLDLLARGAALLHARSPGVRLVIAGAGPGAGDLAAALPWARLCGGLDREAIAIAFASADIFLLTSPGEPWGNVLLEAAASGLAIVASSGGAMDDVLAPAGACVLPPPRDAEALAAALSALVERPAERRRLASAAVAAADAASIAASIGRWIALWRGLSRRGRPS